MSTVQKPRNSQIQYKNYINSSQIMILDPEYTEEELDAKYDTLLSEYTKLKEQINSFKSEKQIEGETQKYVNSIKNISSPQATTNNNNDITENINKQKSRLSEIVNRFALENQELQNKVADKRGKLEEKTKSFNLQRQAKVNALQTQKEQESKQINRIKSEIVKLTNDINEARLQQDKIKQRGVQAASSQEKNKQAENTLRGIIDGLKKQVAESEKKVKELKNQVENGNKELKNPSKNQKKPEDLKKSLENATQQIAKKRKDLQQTEKSILVEKEVQTKAQTNNKQIYNKEADLRKRLESNKSEGQKLKKLIVTHEQNKKKIQQKKANAKKPDQSVNELNKLENQNRFHQNGIKWQEKKLNDFIEVKKKYVDKKELQALNEKKIQYQNLNKNFSTSAAEYKSVEKKLKEVQDVINKINKENSRVITDKETQLSQLKGRTAELSKKREEVDKNLIELKSKLDLYKKEYPNFERENKQDQQILNNIKNALQQKKIAEKAEKKQKLTKKEKKKEQTDEQYLQKMLPKSTSDGGFGEAILANPTYKYSAIGVAVVLVLVAYYSL